MSNSNSGDSFPVTVLTTVINVSDKMASVVFYGGIILGIILFVIGLLGDGIFSAIVFLFITLFIASLAYWFFAVIYVKASKLRDRLEGRDD